MEAGLNWDVSKTVSLNMTYANTMGPRDQEHIRKGSP